MHKFANLIYMEIQIDIDRILLLSLLKTSLGPVFILSYDCINVFYFTSSSRTYNSDDTQELNTSTDKPALMSVGVFY